MGAVRNNLANGADADAMSRTQMPTPVVKRRETTVPAAAKPDHEDNLVTGALRYDSQAGIPLDLAVPRRASGLDLGSLKLDHRAVFLLHHVDGCSTIGEISMYAEVPLPEVLGCMLGLLADGVIELGSAEAAPPKPGATPISGVFDRVGDD